MDCQVETYSGFRVHERPRRFTWGGAWLEVHQVMSQWVAPGYLCFKVRVADRAYLLKYHQARDVWEAELVGPAPSRRPPEKIRDLLFHGFYDNIGAL